MTEKPGHIPERIQKFIRGSIDSVEQLHVLALLYERRDRDWTLDSISQELRSASNSIGKRVRMLIAAKVLTPESLAGERVRYVPVDEQVDQSVRELIELSHVHQYRIIELIFSKPNPAIQSFADAFRFKKDEEE